MLFNSSIDTEKTIFNYYLIEIIPILNKFYEKLIDIELPKTLSEIISQNKDIDFDNFFENDFFSFNDEENVNNKEQNNNNKNS